MQLRSTLPILAILAGTVAIGGYLAGGKRGEPEALAKPSVSVAQQAPAIAKVPAREVPIQPLLEVESWQLQAPNPAPLAPAETLASRQVAASTVLKRETLPVLVNLQEGQAIRLPLHGMTAAATISAVSKDSEGWARVAGELSNGQRGSFFLSQKGQAFFGRIIQPAIGQAYRITTEPDGTVIMEQKPFASVACAAIPRKPRPPGPPGAAPAPALAAPAQAPSPVPILDSDPSATNVVYLDFDGESVSDPDWNNGRSIAAAAPTMNGARMNAAQITDVWNRVAEDYRPFKISITTDLARYNAAGARHRMRCIVTPTDTAAPGAGGVAWTDSYRMAGIDFSSTVPCWAYAMDYYTTADTSGIISHEVGHTLGLSHDGRNSPYEEYFEGQGSGVTSWAPIMGASYDHRVTQWSKGEYYRANNREDDVAIIGGAANGFGFVADEDAAGPINLPTDGVFSMNGTIGRALDVDQYVFANGGGVVKLTATPATVEPNLDILLEIRNQTGATVVTSNNLLNALNASISTTLPLGTYRVVIRGTGEGSALGAGYSAYGSMGAYKITGTYNAIPVALPVITASPLSAGALVGGKVTFTVAATSAVPPTYQWQKNNANIPGQITNTLVLSSAQAANQGEYRCVVSNVAGSVPSDPATLTIFTKPAITKQPIAVAIAANSPTPLTLSVTATGTETLRYQWQHATVNIPGQTASTLSISNPQWTDGGSYRCIITNDFGTVTSSAVLVTILSPPLIATPPPTAKEVPKGGVSSFGLLAVGSPTLTYQWYHDTVKMTGAIRPLLTLSRITDAAAGNYHCVVTNRYGSITSNDCFVKVSLAPTITLQPVAQTVREGNPFQFTVAATGTETLTYQWQRDGVNVGTGATYSVGSAAWGDRGLYRCIVANGAGSVTSKAVVLTVQSVPIITTPPVGGKIAIGAKATLKVVATGSPTLRYQWRKAGVNIPGATGTSLIITGATNTSYDVLVSNPFNTDGVPSTAANMIAMAPVKITQQPLAKSVPVGGVADFAVLATGDGTISYQWKKNGVAMGGQTGASLHLGPLATTDAALYSVTVTNDVGAITSLAVRLTVTAAPKLIQRPLATTVKTGAKAILTASAIGSGTLTYHWQKDNADIIGATGPTLTIASAQASDAGMYRVVVSNAADKVHSESVPLKVQAAEAPTVASFTPSKGPAGSYVRVSGTGFDGLTKATMAAADGGFAAIPFVIVSPEKLLVTVPASAGTSAITLSGPNGTVTPSSVFTVTAGQANEDAANAQIILGTGGSVASTQAGWYSWTPTISGTYAITSQGTVQELDATAGTPQVIYSEGDLEIKATVPAEGVAFDFELSPDAQGDWTLGSAVRLPLNAGGQTLVPGEKYHLEFVIDDTAHTWGALLNGEWIVENQALGAGSDLELSAPAGATVTFSK